MLLAPAQLEENLITELLRRTRRAFFFVGVFSMFINMLMLALPLYSLQVLDRVLSSHSLETLALLTMLMVVIFIFYGVFSAMRTVILSRICEWLDMKLAPKLIENSVVRSAIGAITSASQHQRDLTSIKSFITSGITTLFDAPFALIFILVIYLINPVLGFITVSGSVLLLGIAVLTEFATKKTLHRANLHAIHSMNIAEIAGRNAEAVEAMGMLPNVTRNWMEQNQKSLNLQNAANSRSNIIQSVTRVLRMILQIAITGVGCLLALNNHLSVGGMIAASILAARALSPFESAIGIWKSLVSARDAYERLKKALGSTPKLRGSMELPAPHGHVSVENLFFKLPNVERPILRGINFTLQPGESLGVIGPSAAGKSTLAKLLIGILPPTQGSVRLDGAEIFKWNRENLGPNVGYMPQDVELFAGSIKDNIARMESDAPAAKVIEAAQMAGMHHMVLRLPRGYETEFSLTNVSLSPGQRQRIGLARALYGNPRYIVLDEPNSNLDSDGERALAECLARLKSQGLTFIVVAHRPSIVASVDKILVLRDGMQEMFGPREEILRKFATPGPRLVQPKQGPQTGTTETEGML